MNLVEKILEKLKSNNISVADDIAMKWSKLSLSEQIKIDKETIKMKKRLGL